MIRVLRVLAAVTLAAIPSILVQAQTELPFRVQTDGRGFASIGNFSMGQPYVYQGRVVTVVELEVSITKPPPCYAMHL
jgi:hypothetical protein